MLQLRKELVGGLKQLMSGHSLLILKFAWKAYERACESGQVVSRYPSAIHAIARMQQSPKVSLHQAPGDDNTSSKNLPTLLMCK